MTSLPDLSLHLELSDGRRTDVVVTGIGATTTVAEIAALATPDAVPLTMSIDGRPIAPSSMIGRVRVANGSTLRWNHGVSPDVSADADRGSMVRVVGGPDWGTATVLTAGRHVVGRAPGCGVVIDDPTVAPRHAVLTIDRDGRAQIDELGVGRPIEVRESVVQIGSTVVTVEPSDVRSGGDGGPRDERDHETAFGHSWTEPVVRPARRAPIERPPIRPPDVPAVADRLPSGLGLVSALVVVLGGVVAGLVLGQPTMILLSVLGAAGAMTTVGVQAVRDRRARAGQARTAIAEHERFASELAEEVEAMHRRMTARPPWSVGVDVSIERLWERRLFPGDGWSLVLGVGDVEWTPPVVGGATDPVVLHGVGVPVECATGSIVAVSGGRDEVDRMVRSLVLQAACRFGPADLRIVRVPGDGRGAASATAGWLDWLPHVDAELAVMEQADGRTTLVVVDGADALAVRTSPVRRWLDSTGSPAWVVVACGAEQVVPQMCTHVVRVRGATGTAELHVVAPAPQAEFARAGSVQRMAFCGLGEPTAGRIARALAGRCDPEAPVTSSSLPDEVAIDDVLADDCDARQLAAAWTAGGVDPAPLVALGRAADGLVELDLHRDGPHALVAGTTGAGKSELLRSLVLGLAMSSPPDLLQFVLVDYKGGSAFDRCAGLPHIAGAVTDLDDRLAARMLASFDAELKRRERVLRDHRAADLSEFRRAGGSGIPRLVVVIDEFAALAAELPEFLSSLVAIAQRGRSLGVHLVLATQRPNGVVDDDIRANTNVRLCLRVQDTADAMDVIGDRRAAELPRTRPGRAMLRLGGDAPITFQTARCTGTARAHDRGPRLRPLGAARLDAATPGSSGSADAGPTSLAVLADRLIAASAIRARNGSGLPAPLWSDPLPAFLPPVDDAVVGEIDDVGAQCRRPLRRAPGEGHLVVAGALGTGVSTTLARVATSLAAETPPDALHLFVIDGAGSGALDALAHLPHCGGVVVADDEERLTRLVALLERILDRSGPTVVPARTVVVIDDAGALRTRLATPELAELADRVARIVAEGPAGGIEVLFGIDHCSALPMTWLSRCGQRWIGRLADPLDAAALGLPGGAALRAAPPGRFVVGLVDGRALDAQIVAPTEPQADRCDRIARRWMGAVATVATVGASPVLVRRSDVPPAIPTGAETGSPAIAVPLGVHAVTLEPLGLGLQPGDHGLVLGPSRSGRTAALRLLVDVWSELFGPEHVTQVSGRDHPKGAPLGCLVRAAERSMAGDRCVVADRPSRLVVVDDAERYGDPDGTLARLLADDPPGLHVVAAGRPDALRSAGYAHWTAALRRPSWGLLLGALHDTDADLLGTNIPRRQLRRGTPPAGRGLLVAEGRVSPIQVAWTEPFAGV